MYRTLVCCTSHTAGDVSQTELFGQSNDTIMQAACDAACYRGDIGAKFWVRCEEPGRTVTDASARITPIISLPLQDAGTCVLGVGASPRGTSGSFLAQVFWWRPFGISGTHQSVWRLHQDSRLLGRFPDAHTTRHPVTAVTPFWVYHQRWASRRNLQPKHTSNFKTLCTFP